MPPWQRKKIEVSNLPVTGVVGKKIEFDVDASKAGRGSLEIGINVGSVECTVVPFENGQYRASFTPQEAKQYTIQLKFNGRNLPKNPFKVDVRSGDRVTVLGPGLRRVPVNQPTTITVRTENRRKIDVAVSITSPRGYHVENCIIDNGGGSYVVQYMPTQAGTYAIQVVCGGSEYSGNPLSSEAFDISAVTTRLVSNYTVGETVGLEIDTSRAGDGALQVTILRENNRLEDSCVLPHTVTPLLKGLCLVKFTPSSRHPTYASILFNSTELPQSPIRLDCHPPTLHVGQDQSIPAEPRATSRPRMPLPHRDDSILGDVSEHSDDGYVDMSGNTHRYR